MQDERDMRTNSYLQEDCAARLQSLRHFFECLSYQGKVRSWQSFESMHSQRNCAQKERVPVREGHRSLREGSNVTGRATTRMQDEITSPDIELCAKHEDASKPWISAHSSNLQSMITRALYGQWSLTARLGVRAWICFVQHCLLTFLSCSAYIRPGGPQSSGPTVWYANRRLEVLK